MRHRSTGEQSSRENTARSSEETKTATEIRHALLAIKCFPGIRFLSALTSKFWPGPVSRICSVFFLFHQKIHRLASHMASHAMVRWLGVTLSAMSCLDTLGSTVSCIISPPAPHPCVPSVMTCPPLPHVTWCQWLMQSEQCTHPAEPFMRRALLFSECPSTKIFIPCSHLAPATKLSHVTTLYPRVIAASGIFSSSSWIYFWSRRGLFWLSWRCGVWRQCQGYWQTPGDTVWPLTPGTRPDIRLGKQCDQRERRQVQTYTSNFSPPVLRKLAEIERLKCFFLIYFLLYSVCGVLYNMAWTSGRAPLKQWKWLTVVSPPAPVTQLTPQHSSSDIAPNTRHKRPIIS